MSKYNVLNFDKKALIIFDGNCGICNELKNYFSNLDIDKKLKFMAYQDKKLKKYVTIPEELTSKSMYLITSENEIFIGAQAILVSSLYLDNKIKLFTRILLELRIYLLLEPFYRIIAKYRKNISTLLGYDHCIVD